MYWLENINYKQCKSKTLSQRKKWRNSPLPEGIEMMIQDSPDEENVFWITCIVVHLYSVLEHHLPIVLLEVCLKKNLKAHFLRRLIDSMLMCIFMWGIFTLLFTYFLTFLPFYLMCLELPKRKFQTFSSFSGFCLFHNAQQWVFTQGYQDLVCASING